jgi:hypothetical protein
VIQQGQVFKLKARSADGEPLWAYRYRLEGRGSVRPQVGGFASRTEAQKALQKKLARLVPGGRAATLTLVCGPDTGLHFSGSPSLKRPANQSFAPCATRHRLPPVAECGKCDAPQAAVVIVDALVGNVRDLGRDLVG